MTPSYNPSAELLQDVSRWQTTALTGGLVLLAVSIIGAYFNPNEFFQSYLLGFLIWLGLALGSMALVMLQYLTGGAWGVVTRRPLESASKTLPLLAVLFIPVLLAIPRLYNWSHADRAAADPIMAHRAPYMNVTFFVVRAIIYFGIWILFAYFLNKWSRREDEVGDQHVPLGRLAAPGLIVYVFTITFAAIDWAESLQDHWYSTMWGFLFVASQGISAVCLGILCMTVLSRREPLSRAVTPRHFHDLGKLLLMFVMLWAYFAFAQLLIVWSGNLPDEISFFLPRISTSWGWIGGALIVFQFFVPFLLLLSRPLKRNAILLSIVVGLLLCMRWVDLFWIVMPDFYTSGLHFHWLNLSVPLALGGIWVAVFLRHLKRSPLLPLGAPNLEAAIQHGRH